MDKKQFKDFCKKKFEAKGFIQQKNMFYLSGCDVLCGICLQKSNYGNIYYVNYCYFIGKFNDIKSYPTYNESDVDGRLLTMSKTQSIQGKHFITAQIEYEEYSEDELEPYFEKELNEKILPPIIHGKKYILDNLGKIYTLTMNKDEVLRKLSC